MLGGGAPGSGGIPGMKAGEAVQYWHTNREEGI
jgi:hypothetical protein